VGESPIFKLVFLLMPMPVVKPDKAARSFISRVIFIFGRKPSCLYKNLRRA